jgi:uncharacterized protein (TIGR02598 family)
MKLTSKQFTGGFSLVEVTLSLAIVSFAFTSLVALLPMGLHTFRESISTTVKAQITQEIITQATQTEFANLGQLASSSASTPTYYYFNDDAIQVSANKSLYTAAVSYSSSTLPTSSTTSSLVTLRIVIYANKDVFINGVPQDPSPMTYCVHLANFGQRL